MFAVVRTGGKQYRVNEGQRLKVDRLPGDVGATIELGEVLMLGEGADVTLGAPTVAGARVLGTIAEQGRARKVVVFRYKAKTRSRKKTGHRQQYTLLTIDDILAPGQQPKPKQEQAPAEVAAEGEETEPKGRRARRKTAEATAAPVTGSEAVVGVPGDGGDEPASPARTRRKKDE